MTREKMIRKLRRNNVKVKKWEEIKNKKLTKEQIDALYARVQEELGVNTFDGIQDVKSSIASLFECVQEELNANTAAAIQMRQHINELHNFLRVFLDMPGGDESSRAWAEILLKWKIE